MYIAQGLGYDLVYGTGQLARPMSKPSKMHLVAAKHALRYLAGTTDFHITYKKEGFTVPGHTTLSIIALASTSRVQQKDVPGINRPPSPLDLT